MVVDAGGVACPGPLLGAGRGTTSVPMPVPLEVTPSDTSSTLDVPTWAVEVGHEYLGMLIGPGVLAYPREARKVSPSQRTLGIRRASVRPAGDSTP